MAQTGESFSTHFSYRQVTGGVRRISEARRNCDIFHLPIGLCKTTILVCSSSRLYGFAVLSDDVPDVVIERR